MDTTYGFISSLFNDYFFPSPSPSSSFLQSIRNGCEEIPHPSLHTVDKRLSDSDLLKSRSQPQGMSFLRQMKSESNITASMNVKEQLDIHKLVIHPRKQVHFNPVCRVVLIPERIEYHGLVSFSIDCCIHHDMFD